MWVVFSLLASLLEAARFTLSKKLLKDFDMVLVLWLMFLLASPMAVSFCLMTSYSLPITDPHFLIIGVLANISSVTGEVLMIKAIKRTDLALSLPFYTLTPVFVVSGELLFYQVAPTSIAIAGILLIVTGSYLLNLSNAEFTIFSPLKAVYKNTGSFFALLSAGCFSVTAIADKFLISQANQYSYLLWVCLGNLFWLSIYLYFTGGFTTFSARIKVTLGALTLNSLNYFLSVIFTLLAYKLTYLSNVIALKRTTVLWGIVLGYLCFREKRLSENLFGSAIIVIGTAMVIIYTS